VVDAAVSAGTMNFTGANEVLSLADAGQFGASISGFGAGDTIMLSHDVVTGLGVAGNQLTLSTAGGVDTLTFAGNITGAIGVGNDGHGDALVTIIPANVGGGAASVAASQSGMLFYAGGGGDIFTGTAAQLNNDQIANFGSLDKLDITDMAPGATLHFSQGLGVASLTITEGSVSVLVELTGSFTGSHFSLAADGHGGSLLSYSGG